MALVILRAIDQVDETVGLSVGDRTKKLHGRVVLHVIRQIVEQGGYGIPDALGVFELIGSGSGPTRILNLFSARLDLGEVKLLMIAMLTVIPLLVIFTKPPRDAGADHIQAME